MKLDPVLQNTSGVLKHLPAQSSGAAGRREVAGHKSGGHPSAGGRRQDYLRRRLRCPLHFIIAYAAPHGFAEAARNATHVCHVNTYWRPRPLDAPAVIERLAAMHAKKKMPLQRSLARPMCVMALLTLPPGAARACSCQSQQGCLGQGFTNRMPAGRVHDAVFNPSNVHVGRVRPTAVSFLPVITRTCAIQRREPLDAMQAPQPHRRKPSAATRRACRRPAAAPQC